MLGCQGQTRVEGRVGLGLGYSCSKIGSGTCMGYPFRNLFLERLLNKVSIINKQKDFRGIVFSPFWLTPFWHSPFWFSLFWLSPFIHFSLLRFHFLHFGFLYLDFLHFGLLRFHFLHFGLTFRPYGGTCLAGIRVYIYWIFVILRNISLGSLQFSNYFVKIQDPRLKKTTITIIIIIIIIFFFFLYFLSQTNIITDQELHQIFKVPLLGLREPRDIMRKPQHNQH